MPVHSQIVKDIISLEFEEKYGPKEMLSEKAAKRAVMTLAGEAAKVKAPRSPIPPNPTAQQNPLLLAILRLTTALHKKDNKLSHSWITNNLRLALVQHATLMGISLKGNSWANDASLLGKAIRELEGELGDYGIKCSYKHTYSGSRITLEWPIPPSLDTDEEDDPANGTAISGKTVPGKGLSPADGADGKKPSRDYNRIKSSSKGDDAK